MHLTYRNVNDAFNGLVQGIHTGEIRTDVQPSRVGETLQCVEPMIVTYGRPLERVLFNTARDCNPFMHLFEALWMLAGRNDVAPMKYLSSKIGDIASDDGLVFNGAYGYRWRMSPVSCIGSDAVPKPPLDRVAHPSELKLSDRVQRIHHITALVDQLQILAEHLKAKPNSRRAVLQMWNVEDDLLKIDSSKDVCCNISVMFSVESGDCRTCDGTGSEYVPSEGPEDPPSSRYCMSCKGLPHDQPRYLNMTVTNRSNDLIWGMLGANVVHFSFLLEYMAARIGLEVGTYNQFTNNLHVYTETNSGWHPKEWLAEYGTTSWPDTTVYDEESFRHFPLVANAETFDEEVKQFVDHWRDIRTWSEPFLEQVAKPLMWAFSLHKERKYQLAIDAVNLCRAEDWKIAAREWILRRQAAWEEKQANG